MLRPPVRARHGLPGLRPGVSGLAGLLFAALLVAPGGAGDAAAAGAQDGAADTATAASTQADYGVRRTTTLGPVVGSQSGST